VTYLYFHFVFVIPVIIAVIALTRMEKKVHVPKRISGIVFLALIALIYTTPWDNYLVASGIWSYGEGRVMESWVIGHVPFEEYLFFILQPIMTGSILYWYLVSRPDTRNRLWEPLKRGPAAWIGGGFFLSLTVIGALALFSGETRWTYLGLILVWAGPVLSFQWLYGGRTLLRLRGAWLPAVVVATLYLCCVDRIAIEWRIWEIHLATSSGLFLFGLPMEEALFFLVTNLMVVQGLILYYQFFAERAGRRQLASRLVGHDSKPFLSAPMIS